MTLNTVGALRKAIQAKSTRKVLVHVQISPKDAPGMAISKAAAMRLLKGTSGDMLSPFAMWLDDEKTLLDIGGFRCRGGNDKLFKTTLNDRSTGPDWDAS